jgi:transcriptional regulator with XRE-family HTH domain
MYQGEKVNKLIDYLGLKHNVVAKKVGYHHVTLSKKATDKSRFPNDKLLKLSEVLGVSVEYLKDTSQVFDPAVGLPPEAVATPAPPSMPPTGDAELDAVMLRMLREVQHHRAETKHLDAAAMIVEELRLIREEVNEIHSKLNAIQRDLDGDGEHDPD